MNKSLAFLLFLFLTFPAPAQKDTQPEPLDFKVMGNTIVVAPPEKLQKVSGNLFK